MNNLPTAIDYNAPEMIRTLKATVAQNLTNEEFVLFSQFAQSTKLNPFKKEVWAIKAGGRLQIMTGINGFLAIANSHPQFDGMEVDVETEGGRPTKAICKVYRKDRKFPSVGIALMREFGKETPIWKQMPSVMLTKCAKSIALREAFPQELNGLYTQEEMPAEYAVPEPIDITPKPVALPPGVKPADQVQPAEKCKYDLEAMEEEERAGWVDRLQAKGCKCVNGLWETPKPIAKLEPYRVTAKMEDLVSTLSSVNDLNGTEA